MLKSKTFKNPLIVILLLISLASFSCTSIKTEFVVKPYTEYEKIHKRVAADSTDMKMVNPIFVSDNINRTIYISDIVLSESIQDKNFDTTFRYNFDHLLLNSSYWTLVDSSDKASYNIQLHVNENINDIYLISLKITQQDIKQSWIKEVSCPASSCIDEIGKIMLPHHEKTAAAGEKIVEEKIPVMKYSLEKNQTEYFDGLKALGVIAYLALIAGTTILIIELVESGYTIYPWWL